MPCNTCGGPTEDNLTEHFGPSACIEHLASIIAIHQKTVEILIQANHSGASATKSLLQAVDLYHESLQHCQKSTKSLLDVVTKLQDHIECLQEDLQEFKDRR